MRQNAPVVAAPQPEPIEAPPAAAALLKLVGIAEDSSDYGPVHTAIVSGFGDLFLVKEGDSVTERYRVTRVSAEAAELLDLTDNTAVRLVLK